MIDLNDFSLFMESKSTLKETSKNINSDPQSFMTDLETEAVNFDWVTQKYIKNLKLKETPKSNDALFKDSEKSIAFVEFKSGCINENNPHEIKRKIFNSVPIFTDIIQRGISYTRKHVNYILVYSMEKNPIDDGNESAIVTIGKRISEPAKESFIRFGLEIFQNYFFKKVYTFTKNEFDKKYS